MTRERSHSHYDTLRVDRGASPASLRTAYRRLAQQFHPDKHPGKSAAAIVMAQINQAYEVLSDPAQRATYDNWLEAEDTRLRLADTPVPVFTPDRFGWAGWLLFATASLAIVTVGYVVLATWWPVSAQSSAQPVIHAPAHSEQAPRETGTVRASQSKETQ